MYELSYEFIINQEFIILYIQCFKEAIYDFENGNTTLVARLKLEKKFI